MLASRIRVAVIATFSTVVIGATPMNAQTRTDGQLETSVGRLESEKTVLYVDNRNRSAHVYAVTMAGQRRLLGTVNAASTREFEIPPSLFQNGEELQIKVYPLRREGRFNEIRPEGSGIKTPPIAITAGDRIELIVGSSLSQSTVSVVQD
jgi:hypothetical protein